MLTFDFDGVSDTGWGVAVTDKLTSAVSPPHPPSAVPTRITEIVRRFWALGGALLVALIGGTFAILGSEITARVVISAFALFIAGIESVDMIKSLLRRHFGIDILAVTAIIATVVVGEYWASLIIVIMFVGGEALEEFAERRAKAELTALLDRTPRFAHVQIDGNVRDVAVGDIDVADVLFVKPGEQVPVDGVLLSDVATLDESSLTGESLPVERATGDTVISGSVNGALAFRMRVTARAEDSQYQHIVALVSQAAESKAPFVRMADRFAVPFTIAAYVLAVIGWVVSGEPARFAEVLVVATPCPLILAVPVAFLAGMSRSARHGIIVKNGGTLEKLSRVRTVAFDKTGTLTHGQPVVSNIYAREPLTEDALLRLVAIAEQTSAHTLAQSLVTTARFRGLDLPAPTSVEETTAHGLTAQVENHTVVVGKFGFALDAAPEAERVELAAGELAVYVAVDGAFAGAVILRDEVREDARETLATLSRLGIRHTLMLTGDAEATAQHVAAALGVTDVKSECLPADKVTAVASLTDRPVMMVGDGVNDAPVLAAADVGVAMGARGSTAASESADVVIMRDELSRVARAIEFGQATVRIATQSIWIGIAISSALMVLAVFGWIPAILGATFQELIDLITILNALRALGSVRSQRARRRA